ncbi:MAG: pentapeptide repeat-containing protein [Alphaproteobacteria bacterium]
MSKPISNPENNIEIPQKKLLEEIFNQKSVDEHEKDFFGAELRKANFEQLNLTVGDFHSANLPLANLTGADLSEAILEGIDFSTVKIDNVKFGDNIKALINIEKMTNGNAYETRGGISGDLNNIKLDDSKVIKHIEELFNSKSLKKNILNKC